MTVRLCRNLRPAGFIHPPPIGSIGTAIWHESLRQWCCCVPREDSPGEWTALLPDAVFRRYFEEVKP